MADTRKRFRFTVPPNDAVVMAWLAAQENIGMSLRQLIKLDSLAGISDVMCRPLPGQAQVPDMFRQAAAEAEEERIRKAMGRRQETIPVRQMPDQMPPQMPVHASVPKPLVTPAATERVSGQETENKNDDIMNKWF